MIDNSRELMRIFESIVEKDITCESAEGFLATLNKMFDGLAVECVEEDGKYWVDGDVDGNPGLKEVIIKTLKDALAGGEISDFDVFGIQDGIFSVEVVPPGVNESPEYDQAKKIGYLGDEKNAGEWLQSSYAKWRQYVLDTMKKISGGDESKGVQLSKMYVQIFNEFNYSSSEDKLKELAGIIGENPDGQKLLQELQDHWNKQAEELTKYFENGGRD